MQNYILSVEEVIRNLDLKPHPEGGFYKETYRSEIEVSRAELPRGYSGNRNISTAIYFLLTSDTFSAFHRINQDEIWHFHFGSPIRLHVLSENGKHSEHRIGNDITAGEQPQLVVKGGDWFGGKVEGDNAFALVGCTVSPGFDFADFDLTPRKELIDRFPQHSELIKQFTRE